MFGDRCKCIHLVLWQSLLALLSCGLATCRELDGVPRVKRARVAHGNQNRCLLAVRFGSNNTSPTSEAVAINHKIIVIMLFGLAVTYHSASPIQHTRKVTDVPHVALQRALTEPRSDACCPCSKQYYYTPADAAQAIQSILSVPPRSIPPSCVPLRRRRNLLSHVLPLLSTKQRVGVIPVCSPCSEHILCLSFNLAAPAHPLQTRISHRTSHC